MNSLSAAALHAPSICHRLAFPKRFRFEVKPGIIVLRRVRGRSRLSFDDMDRLDLQYARLWSLWLDVKILLQAPGAELSTNSAH
ncbi:MAG: sugar transferase [Candidatus Korobacteraceae bacterium]